MPAIPNFFIVGAAKSGTTSLANYVAQHPKAFLCSPKEPNYFAFKPSARPECKGPVGSDRLYELLLKYSVTDSTQYAALFAEAQEALAVGEASVRYLYYPEAADRIAEFNPAARIIVVLRNPVDRMHSHYFMNVSNHIEPATFEQAIDHEDQRVEAEWGWDWHYRRVSSYVGQLRRYFERFPAEQMLVLSYDSFRADPAAATRLVWQHLGLDAEQPTLDVSRRHLVGIAPASRTVDSLVHDDSLVKRCAQVFVPKKVRSFASRWLRRQNRRTIPALSDELRRKLAGLFEEEKSELQQLVEHAVTW